jgi:glyoxylate carboligase
MGSRVANVVVESLPEFSVESVFGIPRDSINPVVDAMRKHYAAILELVGADATKDGISIPEVPGSELFVP